MWRGSISKRSAFFSNFNSFFSHSSRSSFPSSKQHFFLFPKKSSPSISFFPLLRSYPTFSSSSSSSFSSSYAFTLGTFATTLLFTTLGLYFQFTSFLHNDSLLMQDELQLVQDPSTKLEVPRHLHLHGQPYQLVGVGARQVSFLRINVYTVGLYTLRSLPSTPPSSTSSPSSSSSSSTTTTTPSVSPPPSSLIPMEELLQSDLVLYITPTRTAELTHLRDGFIKHIKKDPQVEANHVTLFTTLFPKSRILKGETLILEKHPEGLTLYFNGEKLGDILSPKLAYALFKAYVTTDSPVSPKLIESMKATYSNSSSLK